MASFPIQYYSPKSPHDDAPYAIDFTPWLIPATGTTPADVPITAAVSVSGPDDLLISVGALITGNVVTTMLSAGTIGFVYTISFLITTQMGITVERSGMLQVIQR